MKLGKVRMWQVTFALTASVGLLPSAVLAMPYDRPEYAQTARPGSELPNYQLKMADGSPADEELRREVAAVIDRHLPQIWKDFPLLVDNSQVKDKNIEILLDFHYQPSDGTEHGDGDSIALHNEHTIVTSTREVGRAVGNKITLDAKHLKEEKADWGVVVHELFHALQQNYTNATVDTGTIEALADYVRYAYYERRQPKSSWGMPEEITTQVTEKTPYKDGARFFLFLEAEHPGFVQAFHKALQQGWDGDAWLRKQLQTTWKDLTEAYHRVGHHAPENYEASQFAPWAIYQLACGQGVQQTTERAQCGDARTRYVEYLKLRASITESDRLREQEQARAQRNSLHRVSENPELRKVLGITPAEEQELYRRYLALPQEARRFGISDDFIADYFPLALQAPKEEQDKRSAAPTMSHGAQSSVPPRSMPVAPVSREKQAVPLQRPERDAVPEAARREEPQVRDKDKRGAEASAPAPIAPAKEPARDQSHEPEAPAASGYTPEKSRPAVHLREAEEAKPHAEQPLGAARDTHAGEVPVKQQQPNLPPASGPVATPGQPSHQEPTPHTSAAVIIG